VITVEEKEDGTQVWTADEGEYTFVQLSTLHAGDRLEVDHRRTQARVLSQADINGFATTGPDPAEIFVRVRSATPADKAKPRRGGPGGGGQGGGNPQGQGGNK
jgi:hypothetical protein